MVSAFSGSVTTPSLTIYPPMVITSISVSSETPSSVLFIFGTGFNNVGEVDIGSTQITNGISVTGTTQITVTIPGGTATGTVKLVDGAAESTGNPTLYAHSNGLGQTYYSINPLSTFSFGDASSAGNVWSAGSFSTTTWYSSRATSRWR